MDEKYVVVKADFRKYPCVENSITNHSVYLPGAMSGKVKRYEGLNGCTDYRKAVQIIKDGDYVEKLCSIIERWELTKWDVKDAVLRQMTAGWQMEIVRFW